MIILVPILFISLILVIAAVMFFIFAVKNRDMQLQDQISLMPLEEDETSRPVKDLKE